MNLEIASAIGGTGLYNVTSQNTTHLRAAIARVRAGSGTAKIACIGDSTTVGCFASGAGNTFATNKPLAFPNQLAKMLTARGLPAQNDSFWGGQNVFLTNAITDYQAYNSQVVFTGSGWNFSTYISLGAQPFQNTTTGDKLAFTPASAFDTIDVVYLTHPLGTNMTVNVDGGATLATCNCSGTAGVAKTTITGVTRATHTINLVSTATGGSYIFPVGVTVRDSTTPRVEIYNMGFSGGFVYYPGIISSSYANTVAEMPYGYLTAMPIVAPDVTFINLMINDVNNQVETPATYLARLGTMVTAAQAVGDCVLMVSNPCGGVNWSNGVSTSYASEIYALSKQYNCPLIDLTARWQSFAVSSAFGYYGDPAGNQAHPSTVGHQDIAAAIASIFQ